MINVPAKRLCAACCACALVALLGAPSAFAADRPQLDAVQPVRPVPTLARGDSLLEVDADGRLTGEVLVEGLHATAAYVHEGAAGTSGQAVVPLLRFSERAFIVPPGTRLSPPQLASFRTGQLYVSVQSAAHPEGAIRIPVIPE